MATRALRFLTASQVYRLHRTVIDPRTVPFQLSLVESAVNSPMNLRHYAKEEDVFQLAAALAEKLMKNHAFQDGNKRTALLAADMFLRVNGYYLQKVPSREDLNNKETANAQVSVVTHEWSGEQLGNYYKSVAEPLISTAAET